ncbi:hypothetical protein BCR33DRAFT_313574 [Rhizoclosmatium globosum]|uniref:RNI-like protein n=1 Tax=Rhizoclosmatium globosum TaxID=329046 RepID=A0A1Y2CZ21_9FUNG|nr:hypothetical protein BCR33DRAFT_313574 [Rhizoclosmatium globosum]|eukprot:ORY52278.1 hypothetical protein BCR33DRAFT_313574 [Rhizoclosmatium globosum]
MIAEALHSNTTLEKLDLQGNEIDSEGLLALAKAISINQHLRELKIGEQKVVASAEAEEALAAALIKNEFLIVFTYKFRLVSLQENVNKALARNAEAYAVYQAQKRVKTVYVTETTEVTTVKKNRELVKPADEEPVIVDTPIPALAENVKSIPEVTSSTIVEKATAVVEEAPKKKAGFFSSFFGSSTPAAETKTTVTTTTKTSETTNASVVPEPSKEPQIDEAKSVVDVELVDLEKVETDDAIEYVLDDYGSSNEVVEDDLEEEEEELEVMTRLRKVMLKVLSRSRKFRHERMKILNHL